MFPKKSCVVPFGMVMSNIIRRTKIAVEIERYVLLVFSPMKKSLPNLEMVKEAPIINIVTVIIDIVVGISV